MVYLMVFQERNFIYFSLIKQKPMGQAQSLPQEQGYSTSLTFVQTQDDKYFGSIDIYRTKEAPYEYVMDFKKNFIEDNERMSGYLRFVNQLKNMQHKNLAKIHDCQLVQENQVCIKHKKIHTYCNYYNFTLEGAIEKKKLQDSYFQETELVYIMGCLLDAALYLQQYGISLGEYRSKSIFLSPEGYIKLFLLEIEEENRHSCYYKVLSEKHLIDEYILAPEQLKHLNNLQYQIKYDPFKADVFAIGMVILQLITLDKPKFYYNEQKTQLKIDRISFDISSMSKQYSEPFVQLLKGCLQPATQHRISMVQASQQLAQIKKTMKSMTYCIRLQEDEEKSKKNAGRREITMSVKGQHILDGLQKKLTPSPIATLSSSTTSGYKIESRRSSARSSQHNIFKL